MKHPRFIIVLAKTARAVFPPMKKSEIQPRVSALTFGHIPANPPVGKNQTRLARTFSPSPHVLQKVNQDILRQHGVKNSPDLMPA